MRTSSPEVADIFRAVGPSYRLAQAGHLSLAQLKVMSAIQNCRTAALGGHVDGCDDCGYLRVAYNSCRNRHCPKCQAAAARAWLAERKSDLLPVGYFHVVFTLPAEVIDVAWQNKAVVYDLLFRAASEAMMTIAADPRHLGVRVAISNGRLIAFDEAGVTFRYKDYRRTGPERQQVMTLDAHEFMRRFLLHVLPHGFHRIRHYGLFASATRKANIARVRELLAVPSLALEPVETEELPDQLPPCPCCGGRMRIVETFERWTHPRAPPAPQKQPGRPHEPARLIRRTCRRLAASANDTSRARRRARPVRRRNPGRNPRSDLPTAWNFARARSARPSRCAFNQAHRASRPPKTAQPKHQIPIDSGLHTAGSFLGDFRTPNGIRNSSRERNGWSGARRWPNQPFVHDCGG